MTPGKKKPLCWRDAQRSFSTNGPVDVITRITGGPPNGTQKITKKKERRVRERATESNGTDGWWRKLLSKLFAFLNSERGGRRGGGGGGGGRGRGERGGEGGDGGGGGGGGGGGKRRKP